MAPKLTLVRLSANTETTFGALVAADGTAFATTIELPWRHNEKRRSCIPAGFYECVRKKSPTFKIETFYIIGVPNRDGVMFHPANLSSELLGCVAVGHGFDPVVTKKGAKGDGITDSQREWKQMMTRYEGHNKLILRIVNPIITYPEAG